MTRHVNMFHFCGYLCRVEKVTILRSTFFDLILKHLAATIYYSFSGCYLTEEKICWYQTQLRAPFDSFDTRSRCVRFSNRNTQSQNGTRHLLAFFDFCVKLARNDFGKRNYIYTLAFCLLPNTHTHIRATHVDWQRRWRRKIKMKPHRTEEFYFLFLAQPPHTHTHPKQHL